MNIRNLVIILSLGLSATLYGSNASKADDEEVRKFIDNLANILISEKSCGFTYEPKAIRQFIIDHVPSDYLSFSEELNHNLAYNRLTQKDLSQTALLAHCIQIKRLATHFKFIQ